MKLNKTTLRDIIHEILLEVEVPPATAGKFGMLQQQRTRELQMIADVIKDWGTGQQNDYGALIKWVNDNTPSVPPDVKARILKGAASSLGDTQGVAPAAGTETALDEQLHRLRRRRK